MKKISVTIAVILAGCLVYIGSLWQRPLFLFEYAEFEQALLSMMENSVPHCSNWLNLFSVKIPGHTPFAFRIIPALLTLAAGAFIFLAGKKSTFPNAGVTGALIYLLSPAVFFAGTVSIHPAYAAAPAIAGAFSSFLISESRSRRALILWTAAGTLWLALLLVEGSIFLWSLIFIIQILHLLRSRFTGAKDKFSYTCAFLSLVPFAVTALLLFPHAAAGTIKIPDFSHIKLLAAVFGGGFFPWIFFFPAAVKNFQIRFKNICSDNFTFFALLLTAAGIAGALFSPLSAGTALVALAGAAIILGAGIEMEWVENGFHTCNILLYIIAVFFLLAAAFIAVWGGLGSWTQLIPPARKLFSSGDVWAWNVLVPLVAAVWCITAAREKICKRNKFLGFCAGIAFVLLAFHGTLPQQITVKNAPGFFIRQVILPRIDAMTTLKGDRLCRTPLQSQFPGRQVMNFDSVSDISELKKDIKNGKKLCIMLSSRSEAGKLPFPKTVIRAHRFSAVFYNIDFPEMRARKP